MKKNIKTKKNIYTVHRMWRDIDDYNFSPMELVEACNEEHAVDLYLKKEIQGLVGYSSRKYYNYEDDYHAWRIDFNTGSRCELFCQLGDHRSLSFKEVIAESLSKLVYPQYTESVKTVVNKIFNIKELE
jgi:hypothetical protein